MKPRDELGGVVLEAQPAQPINSEYPEINDLRVAGFTLAGVHLAMILDPTLPKVVTPEVQLAREELGQKIAEAAMRNVDLSLSAEEAAVLRVAADWAIRSMYSAELVIEGECLLTGKSIPDVIKAGSGETIGPDSSIWQTLHYAAAMTLLNYPLVRELQQHLLDNGSRSQSQDQPS